MGQCFSNGGTDNSSSNSSGPALPHERNSAPADAGPVSVLKSPAGYITPGSSRPSAAGPSLHEFCARLMMVQGTPLEQVRDTANIIALHFSLPLVSVAGVSETRQTFSVLASSGSCADSAHLFIPSSLVDPSELAEKRVDSSTARVLENSERGCLTLSLKAGSSWHCPPDWRDLQLVHGLNSFLAAPISLGSEVVGVLTLAHHDAEFFDTPEWRTRMQMFVTFVGRSFQEPGLLTQYCSLLETLKGCDNLNCLVKTIRRSMHCLVAQRLHHTSIQCCIAFFKQGGSPCCAGPQDQQHEPQQQLDSDRERLTSASDMRPPAPPPPPPPAVPCCAVMCEVAEAGPANSASLAGSGSTVPPTRHSSALDEAQAHWPVARLSKSKPASTHSGSIHMEESKSEASHLASQSANSNMHRARTLPRNMPTTSTMPGPSAARPRPQRNISTGNLLRPVRRSGLGLVTSPGSAGYDAFKLLERSNSSSYHIEMPPSSFAPLGATPQLRPPLLPQPSWSHLANASVSSPSAAGSRPAAAPALSTRPDLSSKPDSYRPGDPTSCSLNRASFVSLMMDLGLSRVSPLAVEGQVFKLDNSLLAKAIQSRSGVWLSDCLSVLQDVGNAPVDLLLATSGYGACQGQPAACLVLAAMYHGSMGAPLLAVYLSMQQKYAPATLDMLLANLTEALLVLEPLVISQLEGPLEDEWNFLQRNVLNLDPPKVDDGSLESPTQTTRTSQWSVADDASGQAYCSKVPHRRAYVLSMSPHHAEADVASPSATPQTDVQDDAPSSSGGTAGQLLQSESSFKLCLNERTGRDGANGATAAAARPPSGDVTMVGSLLAWESSEDPLKISSVLTSAQGSLSLRPSPALQPHFPVLESPAAPQLPPSPPGISSSSPAASASSPLYASLIPTRPFVHQAPSNLQAAALAGSSDPPPSCRDTSQHPKSPPKLKAKPRSTPLTQQPAQPAQKKTSLSFTVSTLNAASNRRHLNALITSFQDKVQQAQRQQVQQAMIHRPHDLNDIHVAKMVGSGGFGSVWAGSYQESTVAIKIIMSKSKSSVFENATELAVLSTLSHPSIVQVITFFTDVSITKPTSTASASASASGLHEVGPPLLLRQAGEHESFDRPQSPGPGGPQELAVVVVMEYCDGGTLAEAVDRGSFMTGLPYLGVRGGPRWTHIYQTLLELAAALRYLHCLNLVHRDVKMQNILLKTSNTDPRGFTTKLADFGLVRLVSPVARTRTDLFGGNAPYVTSSSNLVDSASASGAAAAPPTPTPPAPARKPREKYSGTVTHLPPEILRRMSGESERSRAADRPLLWSDLSDELQDASGSHAVAATCSSSQTTQDIYAFGILMFEVVTGEKLYGGKPSADIIQRVLGGQRPQFSPDTPSEYKDLAERCWSEDALQRPSADDLLHALSKQLSSIRHMSQGAGALINPTSWPQAGQAGVMAGLQASCPMPYLHKMQQGAGGGHAEYDESQGFPVHIL